MVDYIYVSGSLYYIIYVPSKIWGLAAPQFKISKCCLSSRKRDFLTLLSYITTSFSLLLHISFLCVHPAETQKQCVIAAWGAKYVKFQKFFLVLTCLHHSARAFKKVKIELNSILELQRVKFNFAFICHHIFKFSNHSSVQFNSFDLGSTRK